MSTPKKRPSARANTRPSTVGHRPPVIYALVKQSTKDRLAELVADYGGTIAGYLDHAVWLLPPPRNDAAALPPDGANVHRALAALHGGKSARKAVAK